MRSSLNLSRLQLLSSALHVVVFDDELTHRQHVRHWRHRAHARRQRVQRLAGQRLQVHRATVSLCVLPRARHFGLGCRKHLRGAGSGPGPKLQQEPVSQRAPRLQPRSVALCHVRAQPQLVSRVRRQHYRAARLLRRKQLPHVADARTRSAECRA